MAHNRRTFTEQERAFLSAIHAAPKDDTDRLVYADWLDEQGRADQAEFLRVEIEYGQSKIGDPRIGYLHSRRFALRRALGGCAEWLAQISRELIIPAGLSARGKEAAQEILDVLIEDREIDTMGYRAFYSPAEWRERGEDYGLNSVLIVGHENGALHTYFGGDRYPRLASRLGGQGFWVQGCENWYSAIYDERENP